MYVWLLALLFLGLFGFIGFRTGAVRTSVALVGTWIALAAAGPLGKLIAPLVAQITKENVLAQQVVPALVAFLILWLIFFGLSFLAHRPVELHFKYREDDATRAGFEKLNRAGGLFLGLAIPLFLFFRAGQLVYAGGYLAAQVPSAENDPAWIKFAATLRQDMEASGWDRTFGALDETPEKYYKTSDIIGLVHETPDLLQRLREYPPFLELTDRQDFVDLGGDSDFQSLLKSKPGLALANDLRVRSLLQNSEILDRMNAVDLDDVMTFLRTGESPRYSNEKLLGRWKIDVNTVLLQARRERQNITPAEFAAMRQLLSNMLKPVRLTVYPEGKWVFRTTVLESTVPVVPEEVDPYAMANPYASDPALAARYGYAPQAGAQAQPARVRTNAPVRLPEMNLPSGAFDTSGTWERAGVTYNISSTERPDQVLRGTFDDKGRLVLAVPGFFSLFFVPTI